MKKIAWFVSDFGKGSGGHRTIFQNILALEKTGYLCDLYIISSKRTPEELRKDLNKWYVEINGDIYVGTKPTKNYDMAIATEWTTVDAVVYSGIDKKIYFVQDFEPWFFPMGEKYINAEKTYSRGLECISVGHFLQKKLRDSFNINVHGSDFCADINAYHEIETEKEDAVCFIFQPDKPRRCAELGLKALQIVQKKRPKTKIYLYGSPQMVLYNLEAKHLGILTTEECNRLYNKCTVGLCLSSSNPSRIPFEMMASGLPVVDLYLDNNLYDFPEKGCLLADPSAESIAEAILKILDDNILREKLSKFGKKYMQGFSLEKGFLEFCTSINGYFSGHITTRGKIKKSYTRPPIKYTGKIDAADMKEVRFKTVAEIQREKAEEEARRKIEEDKKWRENLTFSQRVFLKIRYLLFKK